ncbi:MAG: oxidoreductase [Sphingomonas sp.]|nr:oxidoreductase [Sphingomonas sp.]
MSKLAGKPAPGGRTGLRLGFLGTGWIGRNRMAAICATGLVDTVFVSDPDPVCREEALALARDSHAVAGLNAMLNEGVDGVVIATPSALHAEQAIHALQSGTAVFCQKPLGRTAAEAAAVVAAARDADRLLAVDFSYRRTRAMEAIADRVQSGALGRIYAVECVFHNAYGPDKPWFYDPHLSGGGCIMDLGVHLVDLLLWALGFPEVDTVHVRRFANGEPLHDSDVAEDHALAMLSLAGGIEARLACSWNLSAGQDAVIEMRFHGTKGSAAMVNRDGSFYDFHGWAMQGTACETLAEPPDDWGGRASSDWAERLAQGRGFDPAVDHLVAVSDVLDRLRGDVSAASARFVAS